MRVLFYNWVDYYDPEGRGGGVTVYQKNLMETLDTRVDVQAFFIAAGISYDLSRDTPRWERVKHGARKHKGRRFELINSGTLAPGHHSFGFNTQVEHAPTVAAFRDFLTRTGPYDIVHFHNLEGLPAGVLRLREEFPDTRFVYTLHNYYPVCPQVNLWHQERENCRDFDGGNKCVQCLPHGVPDSYEVRKANSAAYALKKRGILPKGRVFDRVFVPLIRWASRWNRLKAARGSREARRLLSFPNDKQLRLPGDDDSGLLARMEPHSVRFRERRERIVELMNAHCDKVLCVSDRVGVVAERFGIDPELVQTLYIGTKQAAMFAETEPKPSLTKPDGTLTLGYLGYMRRDKGFFFLLDALEAMPRDLAARIEMVICAKRADDHTMYRLERLGTRLKAVRWADGYKHDELDDLLSGVDVGLVPVLWEDNLPQVAIEMHARHIPLITSDLGGARELGNFPPMVYRSGNIAGFHSIIRNILEGRVAADAYWRDAMAPLSMAEHVEALLETYRGLLGEEATEDEASGNETSDIRSEDGIRAAAAAGGAE